MILIPQLTANALTLKAYSYQSGELSIVNSYLTQQNFEFTENRIPNDRNDRLGIAFILSGLAQVLRLETLLGLNFQHKGAGTAVNFMTGTDGGSPYCCVRLKHMPWEKGCADITASDDHAAFIKCSLLANEENWFGADSKPGTCKKNR
jgi:hypothetical protein